MVIAATFSREVPKVLLVVPLVLFITPACKAQDQPQTTAGRSAQAQQDAGTSTDLFVMLGSDFDRPGLLPKANYNIGIGHTFGFLKKDPIGDELTFSHAYEDCGSGFWHSQFDSDTESIGVMKNFGLPKNPTGQRLHLGPSRPRQFHGERPRSESLLRR
jgi:hypothetical protein